MWFIIIVVVGIIIWMVVAALKSESKESDLRSDLNDPRVKKIVDDFCDSCFNSIESAWTLMEDEKLCRKLHDNESNIRSLIQKKTRLLFTLGSSEKRNEFSFLILIQGFAYSYYLLLDLQYSFPENVDEDQITQAMAKVLLDIGFSADGDTDLDELISRRGEIVRVTLDRLRMQYNANKQNGRIPLGSIMANIDKDHQIEKIQLDGILERVIQHIKNSGRQVREAAFYIAVPIKLLLEKAEKIEHYGMKSPIRGERAIVNAAVFLIFRLRSIMEDFYDDAFMLDFDEMVLPVMRAFFHSELCIDIVKITRITVFSLDEYERLSYGESSENFDTLYEKLYELIGYSPSGLRETIENIIETQRDYFENAK